MALSENKETKVVRLGQLETYHDQMVETIIPGMMPTSLPANGGTASNVSGTVAIEHGGTGATSASGARSNLGLGSAAVKDVPSSGNASSSQVVMGDDSRLSDARPASDVSSWAKQSSKPSYNLDEVADGSSRKIPTKTSELTNDSGYTGNIGTVTKVKVGSTGYDPESGVVSLPAYPTIPSSLPANGGNSSTVNGHTVNADVPAGAVFTDTNTWRPLGTGADDACAGNDARLSNARPASDVYDWAKAASKPSYSYSEIRNTPSSLPASDVYNWAKQASKPSYSYSEISGTPSSLPANGGNADYATSAGSASSASEASVAYGVYGTYTGDGGKQAPNYFGTNRAGFLMSNAVVNGDGHYKNWLYMDNYAGSDVGGATAIGVDRQEARAFIMQSDANRSEWNNSAELITSANIGSQSVNYANSAGYASSAGSAPASDVYSWAKAASKPSYSYSEISNTPSALPASDVYSWAKQSSKPSYSWSEIGSRPTALSAFTNDSGFITSSGSCSYASSAGSASSASYASSAGNASTVNGYSIQVVSSMPASPDTNTIYIVK